MPTELISELQELRAEISSLKDSSVAGWRERFRGALIRHRDIGQIWNFTRRQNMVLWGYGHANALLVDCMNAARGLTNKTRQFIENSMLLPADELRKREEEKTRNGI